jgi:hypothetical protein
MTRCVGPVCFAEQTSSGLRSNHHWLAIWQSPADIGVSAHSHTSTFFTYVFHNSLLLTSIGEKNLSMLPITRQESATRVADLGSEDLSQHSDSDSDSVKNFAWRKKTLTFSGRFFLTKSETN